MDQTPQLRWLKRLVITLTVIMVIGVFSVIGLVIQRLARPIPLLPEDITLPQGALPEAVTFAQDWVAVVTKEGKVLIFDRATGSLRQEVELD